MGNAKSEAAPGYPRPDLGVGYSRTTQFQSREAFAGAANELHVSLASWWEISIKASKPNGVLTLPQGWEERTEGYMAEWNIRWLQVRLEHCRAVRNLPWKPHRDPFDRMLIAQAQVEKLGLLTIDPEFEGYDIKIVW